MNECGCEGEDWMCLNGRLYGPCGHENCTGVCIDVGDCNCPDNCPCGCHGDDE